MTRQQQKFYWSAILPTACEALGTIDRRLYCTTELHERFKAMFLGNEINRSTGEVLSRLRSTMALNAQETHDYFEAIRSHLALFGISFPDPRRWEAA